MADSLKCGWCNQEINSNFFMVNDCNCYLCNNCRRRFDVKTSDRCQGWKGDGHHCNSVIKHLFPITDDNPARKFLNEIISDIDSLSTDMILLDKAEKGIISFTKNTISSGSIIIERSVKDLAFQQETLQNRCKQILEAFVKLNKDIETLETEVNKKRTLQDMQILGDKFVAIERLGQELVKSNDSDFFFPQDKKSSIVSFRPEGQKYGQFLASINGVELAGTGNILADSYVPKTTYLSSNTIISHIVPPYTEFLYVVPKFFQSGEKVQSVKYYTPPFPFSWHLTIFPNGKSKEEKSNKTIVVLMELSAVSQLYIESVNKYNPPPVISSISSSSAPSTPESAFYNPLYFDLKLQVVAPDGRVHTQEASYDFNQKGPHKVYAFSKFWTQPELQNAKFEWGDKKEVHFVAGYRFTTWKREAEALLAARDYNKISQ